MPRKLNGHHPPDASGADYEVTLKLLNALRDVWVIEMKKAEIDPVRFNQLSIVALTQWAAILAVDVNMEAQRFLAVCNAQFTGAYDRAPKFGD